MAREPGPINLNRYDYELSYSGFQTFLKLPVCLTPEDLRAGQVEVAIGGIPWDGTTSSRTGTSLGPRGIRIADHQWGVGYEKYHLGVRIDPFDHLQMVDYGDAQVLHGAPELSVANMKKFVKEILEGGAIPIILGGDHMITWPCCTALAEHYGFGKIGVVHFDAHADVSENLPGQYTDHGSMFRQLIESGAVKGKNYVQIGLRGYWPGPDIIKWMGEQNIRTHFMYEIEKYGLDKVLDRAIDEALDGAEYVYLSVDIDSVDPAYAPGTGSPEPGGFTSREILRAVRRVVHEVGIAAMDLVEVSPPYDVGNNITALLATRIVWEALVGLAMRKAGITERNYLDPRSTEGPHHLASES